MSIILVLAAATAWASSVLISGRSRSAKTLLLLGLALRIAGGLVYLFVISSVYGGGDYVLYHTTGEQQAAWMFQGKWEYAWSSYLIGDGLFIGTQFVANLTALLIYVFGASLPSLFVIFSVIGYAGCVLLARAVAMAYGPAAYTRYLAMLMLFPSLWFWPSALGKDGIVLLGLGLAAVGVAAPRGRLRWAYVAAGITAVFVIRPQMAAVLAVSVAAGFTLASQKRWTVGRIMQIVGGLVVLVVAVLLASQQLGFSLLDLDQLDAYISQRAESTAYGGSSFTLEGPLWLRPVGAFLTVLFRPFPWEVKGATSLVTSLEVVALWAGVLWHRRSVYAMLQRRPRHQLFWMGVVFFVLFGTLCGLSVGNFGTLARQRVHIYPFMFLFLALAPVWRPAAARSAARVRRLYAAAG